MAHMNEHFQGGKSERSISDFQNLRERENSICLRTAVDGLLYWVGASIAIFPPQSLPPHAPGPADSSIKAQQGMNETVTNKLAQCAFDWWHRPDIAGCKSGGWITLPLSQLPYFVSWPFYFNRKFKAYLNELARLLIQLICLETQSQSFLAKKHRGGTLWKLSENRKSRRKENAIWNVSYTPLPVFDFLFQLRKVFSRARDGLVVKNQGDVLPNDVRSWNTCVRARVSGYKADRHSVPEHTVTNCSRTVDHESHYRYQMEDGEREPWCGRGGGGWSFRDIAPRVSPTRRCTGQEPYSKCVVNKYSIYEKNVLSKRKSKINKQFKYMNCYTQLCAAGVRSQHFRRCEKDEANAQPSKKKIKAEEKSASDDEKLISRMIGILISRGRDDSSIKYSKNL